MAFSEFQIEKLIFGDKKYPRILSKIKNPPKVLFYRGNPNKSIFKKSIAVVGSRKMTRYGREVTERFVSAFVSQGVATISGFMYGVDTEVHQKTVDYGGRTIAVFGCGLDVVYPPENEKLYGEILENGGLAISEYDSLAKPHLWKFPQRNRIVAGMATLGVFIIEAGEKSGSLITADLARKMGKKVYAVPGPITSEPSKGTNNLIKKGLARLVTDPKDILGARVKGLGASKKTNLVGLEGQIFELLKREEMTPDEISASLGKSVVEVSQTLSVMSLRGLILEVGGKFATTH